ncbi:LTA synthase family protein [Thaumasiovibrio sp. DFM-14]|uniref:LTA synthase family protein n=1 Tax=Thaumasiovibrio sp. DFM-14 TaxID=3384792 RepID=UPI0039A39423
MFILLVVTLPFIYKVYRLGGAFVVDDPFSYFHLLIQDLPLIGLMLLLYGAARHGGKSVFYLCRALALLLYFIYVIDLVVILLFQTRLYFEDIPLFSQELSATLGDMWWKALIPFAVVVLFMRLFLDKPRDVFPFLRLGMMLVVVGMGGGMLFPPDTSVRGAFFTNVLDANWRATHRTPYSQTFVEGFDYQPALICDRYPAQRPDAIYVVLVESWSNYHSALFGGQNNWTPQLDLLAQQHIRYSQFYANGFTTEAGLYAVLMGRPSILYQQSMRLDGGVGLEQFSVTSSPVKALEALGYTPIFITSGDLSFLGKGAWLQQVGFRQQIGAKDFAATERRYLFNSVADEVLFEKARQVIADHIGQPMFVVIENVSTHAPFYLPSDQGYERSEQKVFRYTDAHLAAFVSELIQDNNMVVVMSDHRAMTAMTAQELSVSGLMAPAHVPAFIAWRQWQGVISLPFQQSDLLPSLLDLIQGKQCFGESRGAMLAFEHPRAAGCVLHARGDRREQVTALCGAEQAHNVLLDGDQTRAQNRNESAAVDLVNYLRLLHRSTVEAPDDRYRSH